MSSVTVYGRHSPDFSFQMLIQFSFARFTIFLHCFSAYFNAFARRQQFHSALSIRLRLPAKMSFWLQNGQELNIVFHGNVCYDIVTGKKHLKTTNLICKGEISYEREQKQ